MKWLTVVVAFVALISPQTTLVQSQCFTNNDRFNVILQTDLAQITDFGLDLLSEFVPLKPNENVFFSPYSIWSALTLAYFGSGGETEAQLQSVLRVGGKIEALRVWKAIEITYQLRSLIGVNYIFNLANRIYVDIRLPFRNCTQVILKEEVKHIDFRNIVSSVEQINKFVSDTTNGRITDLLDQDALSDALMVLVNAAYFKGFWQHPFKPSQTVEATFKSDRNEGKVKMMTLNDKLKYGESSELGVRLLELPYDGNVISMYILLPTISGDAAFDSVVQGLKGSALKAAMADMATKNVNLKLPKFTLKTTLKDELTDALGNLGVTDLFNRTTGNLTRFVDGVNLSVDKALHKAFIEVTEEGAEAFAATVFVINTRAGGLIPKDVVQFHCDRPFIFYLFDNDTNNVLFMGVFRVPK